MQARHNPMRLAAAVAAASLALAAGPIGAQTTDALPPVQKQGQVQFLTGGFGYDESEAIKAASSQYPLALTFASSQGGAYLADVRVVITDAQGATVLDTVANGPYLLIKLPGGRYNISARFKDNEQKRQVSVSGNGTTRATFRWDA